MKKTTLLFLLIILLNKSFSQCGCDSYGCATTTLGATLFNVYYGSNVTLTTPQLPKNYQLNTYALFVSDIYINPNSNVPSTAVLNQYLNVPSGGGVSITFDPFYYLHEAAFSSNNVAYFSSRILSAANGATAGNTCFYGRSYQVNFMNIPTPSVSSSSIAIWKGQTAILNAQASVGTVKWYSNSCSGTLIGTGNSISVSPTNTTTYYVKSQNGTSGFSQTFSDCVPVTVSIMQPTTNYYTLTGCNSVIHNSIIYTSSTIVTDTVKSYQGFDSVYNIQNIIVNNITPTTNQFNINGCNSINYNGTLYTNSKQLIDTIKSYQGCDSIYNVTNIVVNSIKPITHTSTYYYCSSVVYNGKTYNSSTKVLDTIRSYQGCDSIYNVANININPITPTTNYIPLNSCNRVTYNHITYYTSTVATDTIKSYQGCDSIYNVLLITINKIIPITNTSYLSGCNSLYFNGIIYTGSTNVIDTIRSYQGCDSIYNVTKISINKIIPKSTSNSITGCNSVAYKGNTYFSTSFVKDTIRSYQGCDSIYNTTLIVINKITPVTQSTNLSGCSSVIYNSKEYFSSDVIHDTIRSYQGCDSIYKVVTITLTPITPLTKTVEYDGCNSVVYNGTTYTASTSVKDTVRSYLGCDSIYNVATITIVPIVPLTKSFTDSGCRVVVYNGIAYHSSIVVRDTVKSVQGCDSIYNVATLTIGLPTLSTTTKSICQGGSYTFNGINYTKTGTYKANLTNSVGCDSVATLVLKVYNPSNDTIVVNTSSSYTWHDSTYTQSGIYTFDTLNSLGCDSVVTLILTSTLPLNLKNFIANIVGNDVHLNWSTATELNTSHFIIQHSADGTSFTGIGNVITIGTGANNYQFEDSKPNSGINYYRLVSVDKNGATSYSKVISVQYANPVNHLTVYPNPVKNILTISGEHITMVQVLDNLGRVVSVQSLHDATNPFLSVSNLPTGVYHVRIQTTDNKTNTIGFIKQ